MSELKQDIDFLVERVYTVQASEIMSPADNDLSDIMLDMLQIMRLMTKEHPSN